MPPGGRGRKGRPGFTRTPAAGQDARATMRRLAALLFRLVPTLRPLGAPGPSGVALALAGAVLGLAMLAGAPVPAAAQAPPILALPQDPALKPEDRGNVARFLRMNLPRVLAFGPDGALYVSQGANNAMGAPDATWGNRPERLLSAAILRLDPARLGFGERAVVTAMRAPHGDFRDWTALRSWAEEIASQLELSPAGAAQVGMRSALIDSGLSAAPFSHGLDADGPVAVEQHPGDGDVAAHREVGPREVRDHVGHRRVDPDAAADVAGHQTRAGRLVARTTRSFSSIFSTSRLRPEKKKVSPGDSVDAKYSSTVPSRRPFLNRTSSVVASTMMPAFSRCCATNPGFVTCHRPSAPSRNRLNRS